MVKNKNILVQYYYNNFKTNCRHFSNIKTKFFIGMIQILFSELPIVEVVVVKNVCWGLVGCACLATIIL